MNFKASRSPVSRYRASCDVHRIAGLRADTKAYATNRVAFLEFHATCPDTWKVGGQFGGGFCVA